MMSALLLATLVLPSAPATMGGETEIVAALRKAEQEGDIESAARLFDDLACDGIRSGRFYLCQGNAYLRAGRLADAIAAYRRAEQRLPRDPALAANLCHARELVLEPPTSPSEPWWPVALRLSAHEIHLAATFLWLTGWGFAFGYMVRPSRAWLATAMFLIVLSGSLEVTYRWGEYDRSVRPEAVVKRNGVILREGNGATYPALLRNNLPVILNAGVEVRILTERPNGWVKVRLDTGDMGWIPSETLVVIFS